MFSQEPRRLLKRNQLMEVICQFRFPEILAIAAKPPVDFQEAIRDEFPQFSARKEIPAPKIAGTPGNFSLQNQPETINYQFAEMCIRDSFQGGLLCQGSNRLHHCLGNVLVRVQDELRHVFRKRFIFRRGGGNDGTARDGFFVKGIRLFPPLFTCLLYTSRDA